MLRYIIITLIFILGCFAFLFSDPMPLQLQNNQIVFRFRDARANRVTVAGTFNNWNPNATNLSKGSDGVWSTNVTLRPGNHEYKYIINGEWMEGDNLTFSVRRESDGTYSLSDPLEKSAPAEPPRRTGPFSPGPQPLSVHQNRIVFYFNVRNANRVNVAGSFNDWDPNATALREIAPNEWAVALSLQPGNYEFKYITNGEWMEGENLKFTVQRDASGNITVRDEITPAPATTVSRPSPVRTPPSDINLRNIDLDQDFPILYNGWVIFRFEDDRARKVTIAGSFNEWDEDRTPLTEVQPGIWLGKLHLSAGSYEYKYVVEGNWMDGANLVLRVETDRDGKLYLPEVRPLSNITYSDKIYVEGGYYFDMRYRESDEGTYRWHRPFQDISLGFTISVIPEVEAFAELNISTEYGNYYTSMDNAYLIFNSDKFRAGFYHNQRQISFNDPLRLLEKYALNFDNSIYLFNELRSEYRSFGLERSLVFIDVPDIMDNLNLLFFASNNREGSDDINSLRIDYRNTGLNVGLTYLNNVFDDGMWGSPDGEDGLIVDDYSDLWINFPRGQGSWQHYDYAIGLNNDENYLTQVSFDVSYSILDDHNLFFQYVNSDKKSAAVAYADGSSDTINDDATAKFVLAGEESSSGKFAFGVQSNFLYDMLKTQFLYSFEDVSLTTIHSDTPDILAKVSPQKSNINLIAKYTKNNIFANLMLNVKDISDVNEGIYYSYFDEYDFHNFQLEGVDNITSITLHAGITEKIRRKDFNADLKIFINDYSIARNPLIDDISTMSIHTHFAYNFYDRFTANLMFRMKEYDIKNVRNSLTTGNLKESFNNIYFDVTYNVTEDVYFQLGYGFSLLPDEDRHLNMPYALNNQFLYAAHVYGGSTIDQLLAAEKSLEDASFFFIKGNMKF